MASQRGSPATSRTSRRCRAGCGLSGIAKDFGRILEGAVWHYGPDHDVRRGDFLEYYRLVEALPSGNAPDFDVYDAATWSSIAVLSEKSVADRSRLVDFPDFTKGKWKTTPPIKLMGV